MSKTFSGNDDFKSCSDDCICADYPQLRGACDEVTGGCDDDCNPASCECDKQMALQMFARAVDRLSASVLLLGQMIDDAIFTGSAN